MLGCDSLEQIIQRTIAHLFPPFWTLAFGAFLTAGALVAGVAYSYATADDMVSPKGYGSRVLSGPEGSIALNNNDTVIAGTNLGGGGGRNNSTPLDYEKLANAIQSGASRAQINLDGAKVSNRIQAPLAMSTRKYSV